MSTTHYSTEQIVAFMRQEYRDYVDGYNQLDRQGLLEVSLVELGGRGETSIPVEFEVAIRTVEAEHKER